MSAWKILPRLHIFFMLNIQSKMAHSACTETIINEIEPLFTFVLYIKLHAAIFITVGSLKTFWDTSLLFTSAIFLVNLCFVLSQIW